VAKVLGGTLGVSRWTALTVCLSLDVYTVISATGVAANHGIQYPSRWAARLFSRSLVGAVAESRR
jgi:hypothetical protein